MTNFLLQACKRQKVKLSDIRPGDAHRKPDKALSEFYQEHGDFIHPIVLHELANGEYEIVHGNRRVASARATLRGATVGETITAIVIPTDMEVPDRLIAELDTSIELNHVAVWRAIQAMLPQKPIAEIAKALGLTPKQLGKYLHLKNLPPVLLHQFERGQIAFGVALKAAKQPEHVRRELERALLIEGRKLTNALIEEMRSSVVLSPAALPMLPSFEDPAAEDDAIPVVGEEQENEIIVLSREERERATQALRELYDLLGDYPSLTHHLDAIADALA